MPLVKLVQQMLKRNQQNLGFKPKPSGNGAGRDNGKTYGANTEAKASSVGAVRRCFQCGSTQHLRNACPELVKPGKHTWLVTGV